MKHPPLPHTSRGRSLAIGLFGVPGIGKSTLLRAFLEGEPAARYIPGSSVIRAVIAPASPREMDGWPAERKGAARAEAIRRLEHMREERPGVLFVCGHFSLRSPRTGGLERSWTPEDVDFYDAFVHLDAAPEQILEQARRDERERPDLTLAAVTEHVRSERAEAAAVAVACHKPVMTIQATDVAARVARLAELLRSLRAQ